MKTWPAALVAHLQSRQTTLCTICKIVRYDGLVQGFTDHDQDLVIDGVTYAARTGYVRSAFAAKSDLSVPNLEISGPTDSGGLDPAEIRAGSYDLAPATFYVVNWADLTMGVGQIPGHHLGEVTITDNGFKAEVLGIADLLKKNVTRQYLPPCDADFADKLTANRCKIDPAAWTETGTVTAIASATREFVANITGTRPANLFTDGLVTWTSGNNAGRPPREVKFDLLGADPSRTITLFLPLVSPIQIGDSFSILAGCNKDCSPTGDCKVKFNNLDNGRGFPDVPGLNTLIQAPNVL